MIRGLDESWTYRVGGEGLLELVAEGLLVVEGTSTESVGVARMTCDVLRALMAERRYWVRRPLAAVRRDPRVERVSE